MSKIKKIDILLKTSYRYVDTAKAAPLLDISRDELLWLMNEAGIKTLTRFNFLSVMRKGSSDICRYVCREAELGAPEAYSPEDVAYIYDLDIRGVERAFRLLGITKAAPADLPLLFYHIPV